MPSLDINFDYNKIQKKVNATKSFTDIKSQYDEANRKAGQSFEKTKSQVSESLTSVKNQTKRYQKQVKNQFEQLLDLTNTTGGNGSGSPSYIKRLLIRTIKNVQPRLRTIVIKDCLTALGCDQQQTYTSGPVYVKVSSIDLFNRLLIDPQDEVGAIIYEKALPQPGQIPFSMNRELHLLTQTSTSYLHKGKSGQDLCTIKYMENLPPSAGLGSLTGPWYEVDLSGARSNPLRVGEFMVDYYDTIRMAEDTDIIGSIMESLSGAISMKIDAGTSQVENASKAELILARILGLCFDSGGSNGEIDTSGIAKIAELDGVDDSFFEFTDIDLRNIDIRTANIKRGVIQFEDCDNIDLPVNFNEIVSALGQLNFYEGSEFENAANNITDVLANNPAWIGVGINVNPQVVVDTNFIKLITNGMIGALITPKMILPIIVMYKALGNTLADNIKSFVDFAKIFKKFFINLVSKVGAIFVEELFKLIKEDILKLIQQVLKDIIKERIVKKYAMILKLLALLLAIIGLITDYRKCKNLIDDILALLNLLNIPGFGADIPLPILYAAQLLDGYSESRAFIGAIEELQSLGIPTGAMPSGAPNFDLLGKFGQMKAMALEDAENNKLQVAVGPLVVTPAFLTVPTSSYGKKF
jgi:hypothetical protein